MAPCAAVGHSGRVLLCTATRGVSRARGGGRAPAVERGEANADDGDDGFSGALGAAAEFGARRRRSSRSVGKRSIVRWIGLWRGA